MTTLAANKPRVFGADNAAFADVPVVASDIIYEGAAVGESSSAGTARPLSGGDAFLGFCVRKADNSAGAANAIKVRVATKGFIELAITGVDNIDDLGATVYAIDDDSFTLTSSTGHTAIGKLHSYNGVSGYGTVYFEAAALRSI